MHKKQCEQHQILTDIGERENVALNFFSYTKHFLQEIFLVPQIPFKILKIESLERDMTILKEESLLETQRISK